MVFIIARVVRVAERQILQARRRSPLKSQVSHINFTYYTNFMGMRLWHKNNLRDIPWLCELGRESLHGTTLRCVPILFCAHSYQTIPSEYKESNGSTCVAPEGPFY